MKFPNSFYDFSYDHNYVLASSVIGSRPLALEFFMLWFAVRKKERKMKKKIFKKVLGLLTMNNKNPFRSFSQIANVFCSFFVSWTDFFLFSSSKRMIPNAKCLFAFVRKWWKDMKGGRSSNSIFCSNHVFKPIIDLKTSFQNA